MAKIKGRIPEEMVSEVMDLASRLYAESTEGYSLAELQAAGREVQIPPEFVARSLQEIQKQRRQQQEKRQGFQILTAGLAGAIALWGVFTYNSLSGASQAVDATWAQVENQLQRRADLIPNLLSVGQQQAQPEPEAALLAKSRETYLQAQTVPAKIAASAQINAAIAHFHQSATANSQFHSDQALTNLQYEIAGTENRLATERRRYNQAVQAYNQKVQAFPNSLVAGLAGFRRKNFFPAQAAEVPKIK